VVYADCNALLGRARAQFCTSSAIQPHRFFKKYRFTCGNQRGCWPDVQRGRQQHMNDVAVRCNQSVDRIKYMRNSVLSRRLCGTASRDIAHRMEGDIGNRHKGLRMSIENIACT
jgi:hypothetical protein